MQSRDCQQDMAWQCRTSHFSGKTKIGSQPIIHLRYGNVHLHYVSKFLFFSWDGCKGSPQCQMELISRRSFPCRTDKHSDSTATTEAVRGHEDSVKGEREKNWESQISMGLLCLFPICTQTLIMPMKFCFLLGKMKKYTCLSRGKIASINLHLLLLAIRSTSNRNVHDVVKVSICQTSLRLSFPFLSCRSAAIFNHEITYSPHPPDSTEITFSLL